MPDEVIETRDERLDRIETDLRNIHGLDLPRMRAPLEAFFDQPDMPEQIAASGRPALIAKACQALANMAGAAGDSPVLKGKFLSQMTRVLSPAGCATVSRSVDLASTRLVLESTNVLPSANWFDLLPQLITREACAIAADSDESRTMGEMAARVGAFPRELQEERMPFLITQRAIETVGMGNDAPPKSVWAAVISTNWLPPAARAEAVENILSPHNCGGLAQCDDARLITEPLGRLAVLPQPLRGERERLILTEQAQNTVVESRNLTYLSRALIAAGTWPPEHRTPALTGLLWPRGTPQTCELFAQSPEPRPLAYAVKAAERLENPVKEQVLHHMLPQQAFRMMAEKGTASEVGIAAGAIPSLPPARRAPAARELLTDRALAAVERGEGNGQSDTLNAAWCMRAASFLPPAEQAEVARKLMTQSTRENYVSLTHEAVREHCRKHFELAIASLPESEQAKWRAALAPPPAEWQSVMAAAAQPGGAAAPREQTAGAPAASRSADAAAPGGP
jgi:hypothetical protein